MDAGINGKPETFTGKVQTWFIPDLFLPSKLLGVVSDGKTEPPLESGF